MRIKISFALIAIFAFSIFANSSAFAEEIDKFQKSSIAEFSEVEKLKAKKFTGKPKIGLALGGGGGRGSAHIGVLKVLDKSGIKFDYICGTSIGSVVGGLYASGLKPEELEKHFVAGMHHFMTVPLWVRIGAAPVLVMPRMVGFHPYDGLYHGNKFRKYIVKGMSDEERQIENMSTKFGAVVLNVLDGQPYIIRKGDFGYAIQASCAVPSLRKPVEIDKNLFCDGGVACNLPAKQCREMGADFVIAVNIDEPFRKEALKKFRKAGSMSRRMIKWALYAQDAPQEAMADILIHPYTEGISLVSTKKSDAKHGVDAGIEAALKALPKIKEALGKYDIAVNDVKKEDVVIAKKKKSKKKKKVAKKKDKKSKESKVTKEEKKDDKVTKEENDSDKKESSKG